MKKLRRKAMMAENSRFSSSLLVLIFLLTVPQFAQGQVQDSLAINKKRLRFLVIGGSVAYGTTLVALDQLWYKNSERQPFQFFNDNAEWKQVDKLGHFYSA